MKTEFDELIPHLEIAHNCIISSTGDCTLVYEERKPVRFTQSSQELDAVLQARARGIKPFPPGTAPSVSVCCCCTWEAPVWPGR